MDYRAGFYDSTHPPPPFGHAMLKYFSLEPGYVNLNNGSFGTVPRPVTRFCNELTNKVEANPDRYHRFSFKPLLVDSRERIAQLVGAHTDEVVFVSNATAAINTVMRNLEWNAEDIIIQTTTTWRSTSRVMNYIADTRPYPMLSTFKLAFPSTHKEIVDNFRTHIRGLKNNMVTLEGGRPKGKIVAVIDAIVANPAVYMPWKEMVAVCREEGVMSLVDGAHALGQEVGVNLSEAKPDFWISNCHKWLYSRRGSAVLYVPFRNQHHIRTSIPTSTHYVSPRDPVGGPKAPNFVMQHEWPGAIDFSSYLCIPTSLEFRAWLGGEENINRYCRTTAINGAKRLAEILGTRPMDETPNHELTLNMSNVELPIPANLTPELRTQVNDFLELSLLREYNVFAVAFWHNNTWWVRCSCQVFNELSDFEKLGDALIALCREVKMTILKDHMDASTNGRGTSNGKGFHLNSTSPSR
ncbi:PLP-dependent transferase [Cylindrobasidium torrendii FP15055 ss-10]|uniref:PLP-dependent transferase n=1 Tax=Cylindrobasidium torrendii FP15055 ss-10 TaxID=1314674 RepID=A0A0D7BG59_9AGAR|nr:PLP-dependent transferase [Cylindrobasidium torrendii FP15055 ss-10]